MANDRLRSAMARAGVSLDAIIKATGVDPTTAQRWVGGRVPHARHRFAIAALVRQDEDYLWPVAPGRDAGLSGECTAEVKAVYAHRADLPASTWRTLLTGARQRISLLGYAMLFFPEQHPNLTELLRQKAKPAARSGLHWPTPSRRRPRSATASSNSAERSPIGSAPP